MKKESNTDNEATIGTFIGFILLALFLIFVTRELINANNEEIEACKNNPESVGKIYLHDDNKGITLD